MWYDKLIITGYKETAKGMVIMLEFTCPVCGNKYQVDQINSNCTFVYSVENKRHTAKIDDPCYECEDIAEKAKKEALEKRKKKE